MKQFKTINQNKADIEIGYKESKQETPEEAIENRIKGINVNTGFKQERSYSEEEVIKILYQFHYDLVNSNFDTKEEWFEQFKKK